MSSAAYYPYISPIFDCLSSTAISHTGRLVCIHIPCLNFRTYVYIVDERTELGLLSECPSLMKKVVDLLSYPSLQDRDQTTPPTVTSIPTVVPPVFTQKRLDIETQDLLRSKCARAVGNFVIDNDHNRGLLADAGGVPALLSTLSPPDTNTQAPLLSPSSLPSPQFHRMLATAAGAIGNLTCDTPKMAVKVADAGGLPRLVSVLDYLSSLLQQLHYPGDNSSNSSDSSSAIVCPVQNIQLPDDVSLLCTFIMRAIIHVADEPAIAKELVVALSLFQHMHTLFSYPSIHNDEAMLQELATCFTPLIFDHAALATKAGLSSTFLRGLLFTSDAINAAGSSATSRDDDSEDDFDEEMYHEIQQACIDCLVPLAQHEPNTIIPVLVDVTVGRCISSIEYHVCNMPTAVS